MPEHNKGAMLVPSQWQDAQYANPDDFIINSDYAVPHLPSIKDMYAEVTPKTQRDTLENYNPAKASTKRSPQGMPNQLRNNITSGYNLDNDNLNYSESDKCQLANTKQKLSIINKSNSPFAEINNSESLKAEFIKGENSYVEINGSECSFAKINENCHSEPNNKQTPGYVNVFDNHSYVSSEAKNDHIKAAYCEMFS